MTGRDRQGQVAGCSDATGSLIEEDDRKGGMEEGKKGGRVRYEEREKERGMHIWGYLRGKSGRKGAKEERVVE